MGAPRKQCLSPKTLRVYDSVRRRQLSPRLRLAARLWAAGAGTKGHIARSLGLNPMTLYLTTMPSLGNPDVITTVQRINQLVEDESVAIGKALALAGRRAVHNIVNTMEQASSEVLRFKAAQDLADRSPETSKTQKVAIASFNMSSDDVKELARTMVEAGEARKQFAHVAEGDFVRVDPNRVEALPSHAARMDENGR